MTLYVNCCAREDSRTELLARAVLENLGGDFEELDLYHEDLKPLTNEALKERTALLEAADYASPSFRYAKQFAGADVIVIAAPYWDLSFPSQLKVYIENIYVTGIVSAYDAAGIPQGLCRAKKLYYVVTAGGPYQPEFSFDYIRTMATQFFGIGEAVLIKAEMLDVAGACPQTILGEAMEHIQKTVGPT